MDTTDTPTKKTPSKWTTWLSLTIGIILLGLGGTSYFASDTINDIVVELGAVQVAQSTVELQPESKVILIEAASIIESAALARESDSQKLIALLQSKLQKYNISVDITPILQIVIDHVNNAYKISSTEDDCIRRLKLVAAGLRHGAESACQ